MKVAIHAALLGDGLPREAFEVLKQVGVEGLEFPVGDRGLNPASPAEVQRIGADLRAAGICPWSVHADFGPKVDLSSPYPEARQAGLAITLLAARLLSEVGGEVVVIHPSAGSVSGDDRPRRAQTCRASLEALLEQTDLPVRFALENMLPHHFGDSAAELTALLDGLPAERIGFCYDTGHARLCPEGLELGRCMAGRMVTVHLQDNTGEGDAHLLPFDGTLDWALAARVLDEAGYSGPYVLETAQPSPEEVIRRAADIGRRLHDLRGRA